MQDKKSQIIQKINESGYKFFASISGGGQSFISDFCSQSGASKSLVGAIIPYSKEFFNDFLQYTPNKYVSEQTARQMAVRCYDKCLKLGVEDDRAIGLAATSSIATDDEREGRTHKFYVCGHSKNFTLEYDSILEQGNSRKDEEEFVNDLILQCLEGVIPMEDFIPLNPKFRFESNYAHSKTIFDQYFYYSKSIIDSLSKTEQTIAIFSGSFNPVHEGHKKIYKLSKEILNTELVIAELSKTNTHKPKLDHISLMERVLDLRYNDFLFTVTDCSYFHDKVLYFKKEFPNKDIVFIVGVDTWERIWECQIGLHDFFKQNNVKFLVFGRNGKSVDKYGHLSDIMIYNARAARLNENVSSTQIRENL